MYSLEDICGKTTNNRETDFVFKGCTSGLDFENKVTDFLGNLGLTAGRTKANDGGVDIVAIVETSKNKHTFSIQCKYYNKPLGKHPIQEIYAGTRFYNINAIPVVITNNRVTCEARIYAKKLGVEIIADIEWDEIKATHKEGQQISMTQHKGLMGLIIASMLQDKDYYLNSLARKQVQNNDSEEHLKIELADRFDEATECEREAARLEQQASKYKQRSLTLQKEAILRNLNYI
ncbi:restriction endonuclease [Bengtsoniella intestinalis]|uniref:restriction endonuclease n=1 Tax=Bengtsoniella intestinalis TaxID=3073143 RepID=UPI00391F125B